MAVRSQITPPNLTVEEDFDPVEAVAGFASERKWAFERTGDMVQWLVHGQSADYSVCYTWYPDMCIMGYVCGFNQKTPRRRVRQTIELISRINECLPVGHFELRVEDGLVIFRNGLLLPYGEISDAQTYQLLKTGLNACDLYHPSFHLALIGLPAERAFHEGTCLSEPQGNA